MRFLLAEGVSHYTAGVSLAKIFLPVNSFGGELLAQPVREYMLCAVYRPNKEKILSWRLEANDRFCRTSPWVAGEP
jgi:hypothetical protein